MKTILLAAGCLAGLTLLAGCATLSREQCLQGDWHGIGLADGQQGRTLDRLDDHRRACRDTPAIVDEAAYQAGREVGLLSYCTPVSGYQVAANGRGYNSVCPVTSEPDFLAGYVLGEQVRRARGDFDSAVSRVDRLAGELESNQDELNSVIGQIANAGEGTDIASLRSRLNELRRDSRRLRDDLRGARYSVESASDRLQEVEARTSLQLQALQS